MNKSRTKYDKIIIGAGLYGLYSALYCAKTEAKILVLEQEQEAFGRATYINQARVHQGYHYPRSLSTALKSAHYFERFNRDFSFCVNKKFNQIYGTSREFTWSDAQNFKKFCNAANIICQELNPNNYFKDKKCDGAFLTQEYTYDAAILREYFLSELRKYKNVAIKYSVKINRIEFTNKSYIIYTDEDKYESEYILNTTYASTNQILDLLGYEKLPIKYELCEIILCNASKKLMSYGFTVMDGPFFSIMPFGKTGLHSLTSVAFTPHTTCYEEVPTFSCQKHSEGHCSTFRIGNCNNCPAKPETAYPYMANLARKYLKDEYCFEYKYSLYSMKPILMCSEIDDSRPTIIKTYSKNPTFVSVLSGKINTIYDLNEVLDNG